MAGNGGAGGSTTQRSDAWSNPLSALGNNWAQQQPPPMVSSGEISGGFGAQGPGMPSTPQAPVQPRQPAPHNWNQPAPPVGQGGNRGQGQPFVPGQHPSQGQGGGQSMYRPTQEFYNQVQQTLGPMAQAQQGNYAGGFNQESSPGSRLAAQQDAQRMAQALGRPLTPEETRQLQQRQQGWGFVPIGQQFQGQTGFQPAQSPAPQPQMQQQQQAPAAMPWMMPQQYPSMFGGYGMGGMGPNPFGFGNTMQGLQGNPFLQYAMMNAGRGMY